MPRPPLQPEELRQRAGVVCVALSGEDMFAQAADAARTGGFVEFRLDSLTNPSAALPSLKQFLAAPVGCTAIATCRRTAFGGGYAGTAAEQVALLEQAVQAGCLLADIEIETAEELGGTALAALRAAGGAVILSWHDFNGTPADLDAVYRRLSAFQPDFLKIVPTAATLRDSLLLIDLLEAHGSAGNLVAMSMGQPGVPTRVMGPRYGSAFTFASPDGHAGTAPGQVAAGALRDLYRVGSISPKTAVYAVAGAPIGASLSPLMHNSGFCAAGMDAVYLPLETADPAELRQTIDRLGIRGLSITMPLKETVLPLLGERDASVITMAACNTLRLEADGSLAGFNTDVAGIVDPLEAIAPLPGKQVLVLGAGGAARAAVFGLQARGAEVFVMNRSAERAKALAAESGATALPREALAGRHFDILINSTPYGMRGKDIEPPITPEQLQCELFFDLVYNPMQTPLLRLAEQRGIRTVPGAAMFVAQGVKQFKLWTRQAAPEAAMLQAVTDALRASGG